MKIGLLGGSFNPPHQGHIHASIEAKKHLELNQIWWLPTKQNPLKTLGSIKNDKSDFDQRLNLCQKITKNYPEILVKNDEINLVSVYTVDLLEKLIKQHPQNEFFFIVGADNIINFHQWREWKRIIELVKIIIIDRGDFLQDILKSEAYLYCCKLNRCYFFQGNKLDISSTEIRKKPKKSSTHI